jgi:N-acetylmuramoyl-L-alanine amidase
MRKLKIIIVGRKSIILMSSVFIILFLALVSYIVKVSILPANKFVDPKSNIIVIDPGHGGIDGGTNKNGILEKEINLDIGTKLRHFLEQKGYKVIMTRDKDISLESSDSSSKSRHQRDLSTRVNTINNSNAQLFISIHVNCNLKKPSTDGAIVFYSNRYEQSKSLAYSIQRTLNNIEINKKKRTVHDPVPANYFVLNNADIPGVIVETAFISNKTEREELVKETFRVSTANAIVSGIEQYLRDSANVSSPFK